jgi:hypothetical protein
MVYVSKDTAWTHGLAWEFEDERYIQAPSRLAVVISILNVREGAHLPEIDLASPVVPLCFVRVISMCWSLGCPIMAGGMSSSWLLG